MYKANILKICICKVKLYINLLNKIKYTKKKQIQYVL